MRWLVARGGTHAVSAAEDARGGDERAQLVGFSLARAACLRSSQAVSPLAKWHVSNQRFDTCHRSEAPA